jgi:hypothetical protein
LATSGLCQSTRLRVRCAMSDVLRDIFTDEIVERLGKCGANLPSAEFRRRVLSLPDEPIGQHHPAACERQLYESVRERWKRWIASAISAGLFQGSHGAELRNRLTGIDDDGFRSALAECMTCWALSSELGLQVQPRPSGRRGRVLEFAVRTSQGEIDFEVKSPRLRSSTHFGPEPEGSPVATDVYCAALAMRAALRYANRQFAAARRNILVIALPEIEQGSAAVPGKTWPASLIRAFYGDQRVITSLPGSAATQFVAKGNLLERPGGVPRFTRTSAVIGLLDSWSRPRLRAAVLHNPCSQKPVDYSIFGEWRQFGALEGEIRCLRRAADTRPSTLYEAAN